MSQVPLIFFHLRLIAKISLAVAALAALALCALLALIGADAGDSYGAVIRSRSLTREYLDVAILVAGLMLIAATAIVTWLIVLYSSHRIAGPLYRFSQNLKLAIASDSMQLIDLRQGDSLVQQAAGVKLAVSTLREHYLAVKTASDQAFAALGAGNAEHYVEAIARLNALDDKVRI